jgi:hypothetical protein
MYDHVAVIEHEPAFAGLALHTAFLFIIVLGGLQHTFGKCVEHAVAGTVADDEVICKRCNILDVKQQDVFTLFVLQGFDDFMGKF